MMSTIKQILKNTVTGWVAVVFRTVIALVMVPFLLSNLGKEGYGLVGLLGVIVSMAGVADLGLRSALGRELTEQVARKDQQTFDELASTAFVLYLFIAAVLAVIGWFLAPWFVTVFKVSEGLRSDAIWLIRIYGTASVVLSFITPVFAAGLSAHHRFDVVNTIQIISGILSSLMLFAVISFVDNALYGWVGVMLVSQLLILAVKTISFKRFCGAAHLSIKNWKPSRLRPLVKLGGSMYALQMTQALSERSDPLVISAFFGPAGVALYQPGGRLSQIIRPVVLTLANQMHPLTTKQHVENQQVKMQKILILGTKYTLLIGSLFSAGMIVFSESFARIWLEKSIGDDYRIAAYVILGWALADMTTYAAGTQWSVLLGMKRLKFLIWTQVPTAILNVLVSIYLVGFTKLGIPGVLAATILIGLIRRPILIWHTANVCGLRPREYIHKAYLTPLVCFLVTLFGAFLVKMIITPITYFSLIVCAGLTALIWAVSSWTIGFDTKERHLVVSAVKKNVLRKRAV
jgi:O-antigen/teichoic acid export membrane protein